MVGRRKYLITGASGFIGSGLTQELLAQTAAELVLVVRKAIADPSGRVQVVEVPDIGPETDWTDALANVEVVFHLAARAHVPGRRTTGGFDEFWRVNVAGTAGLAKQAAAAGVRRFIFVSSVGVNGEETSSSPFSERDAPNPSDPYAVSKWKAEEELQQVAANSAMDTVIIRPPMVYGPDAPGNFGRLLRLIERGLPIPLGAIQNRRSFVAIYNLVDVIVACIDHPAVSNQVILVSDGEDVSTPELVRRVGHALGRVPWLISVPESFLLVAATMLSRQADARRLLGSLQVDISKVRQLLGWTPPVPMDEALRRVFEHSAEHSRKTRRFVE